MYTLRLDPFRRTSWKAWIEDVLEVLHKVVENSKFHYTSNATWHNSLSKCCVVHLEDRTHASYSVFLFTCCVVFIHVMSILCSDILLFSCRCSSTMNIFETVADEGWWLKDIAHEGLCSKTVVLTFHSIRTSFSNKHTPETLTKSTNRGECSKPYYTSAQPPSVPGRHLWYPL